MTVSFLYPTRMRSNAIFPVSGCACARARVSLRLYIYIIVVGGTLQLHCVLILLVDREELVTSELLQSALRSPV